MHWTNIYSLYHADSSVQKLLFAKKQSCTYLYCFLTGSSQIQGEVKNFLFGEIVSQRRMSMAMPTLPRDIIENILPRLPVKPFVRFRCVSQSWQMFLTDPEVIKTYDENNHNHGVIVENEYFGCPTQNYYYVSCDEKHEKEAIKLHFPIDNSSRLYMVGSSNGVLCLADSIPEDRLRNGKDVSLIYLWNPTTQQSLLVPIPERPRCSQARDVLDALGFGFQQTANDYKLVMMNTNLTSCQKKVEVYSLKTNSWKRVRDAPRNFRFTGISSVLVNGALHWLMGDRNRYKKTDAIISFDMNQEVFSVVVLVPDGIDFEPVKTKVSSYKGCVSVHEWVSFTTIHIWVLKEYRVRQSWAKQFTIKQPNFLNFHLVLCENGESAYRNDKKELVFYNGETGQTQKVQIPVVPGYVDIFDAVLYVRSLVSLDHTECQRIREEKGK